MDEPLLTHPDIRILLYAILLLLGIYVSVMYTCWGTLSFSKVRGLNPQYTSIIGTLQQHLIVIDYPCGRITCVVSFSAPLKD